MFDLFDLLTFPSKFSFCRRSLSICISLCRCFWLLRCLFFSSPFPFCFTLFFAFSLPFSLHPFLISLLIILPVFVASFLVLFPSFSCHAPFLSLFPRPFISLFLVGLSLFAYFTGLFYLSFLLSSMHLDSSSVFSCSSCVPLQFAHETYLPYLFDHITIDKISKRLFSSNL